MAEKIDKDWRPLFRACRKAGWRETKTRGGHVKFYLPDGRHTTLPTTPAKHKRGLMNKRAELRRLGLTIP